MRVNDLNLTGASAAKPGTTQEAKVAARGNSSTDGVSQSGGTGDRVELSNTLTSLSKAMSSYGSDRASRVQELTALYQSGNYEPNSLGASKGMVAEALSAGGK